jgi:hypothetical protein
MNLNEILNLLKVKPAAVTDREDDDPGPISRFRQSAGQLTRVELSANDAQHLLKLADLATTVWRLRQRMRPPGTEAPAEQFSRAYRDLDAVCDALNALGLEIHDHTGKPFDPGQSLRVAEWVTVAGLEQQRVHETIKPTIYFLGKRIQKGIVIVETPE